MRGKQAHSESYILHACSSNERKKYCYVVLFLASEVRRTLCFEQRRFGVSFVSFAIRSTVGDENDEVGGVGAIASRRVEDETTRRLQRVSDVRLALAVTYRSQCTAQQSDS